MEPIPEVAGHRFFDATNFLLRENSKSLIKVIANGLDIKEEEIMKLPDIDKFIETPAAVKFASKKETHSIEIQTNCKGHHIESLQNKFKKIKKDKSYEEIQEPYIRRANALYEDHRNESAVKLQATWRGYSARQYN